MRFRLVFVSVLALAMFSAGNTLHAEGGAATRVDPANSRRSFAVNLIRVVNTAEASYRRTHGNFLAWNELTSSQEFRDALNWQAQTNSQFSHLTFASGEDILPGWKLHLLVSADSQHYDALLEDVTDTACGFAVLGDDSGIIRHSQEIQCPI